MLKLSIQDSEGRSTIIPLTDGELSIGRDEANSICLTDRNVSRQHARLMTLTGHVYVENIAATYGTRFNNLLLRERLEVQPGDLVQVGDYVIELVSDQKPRDTALLDGSDGEAAPRPAPAESPSKTKGKAPDGATAIVNLADISALLKPDAAGTSANIPEASQPRLVVESENLRGLELRITKTPIVVGRVRENADLVVDHRSISKEHARLTRQADGTWQVLDLGSANGLKVNGEPYSKCEIRSGDRIELGHVVMRFLAAGARAPGQGSDAAGGKSKNTLLIAGIVLIVLALGAVAAMVITRGGSSKSTPVPPPEPKVAGPEPETAAAAPEPVAEPQQKADDPSATVRKAKKLREAGLLAEALETLAAAQRENPGNPQIELEKKKIELEASLQERLRAAEALLESNPAEVLKIATEVAGQLKPDSPLAEDTEKLTKIAREAVRELKAVQAAAADAKEARPATHRDMKPAVGAPPPKVTPPKAPEPAPEPRVVKPKPEPEEATAPPAEAKKSGKDYYDEGRSLVLAGKNDEAADAFKLAVKNGYHKANAKLAAIFFQKSDKANCAKHAKAYLERYPDAGDAPQIQGMLEKCSN